jgi:hypothetical protein
LLEQPLTRESCRSVEASSNFAYVGDFVGGHDAFAS